MNTTAGSPAREGATEGQATPVGRREAPEAYGDVRALWKAWPQRQDVRLRSARGSTR